MSLKNLAIWVTIFLLIGLATMLHLARILAIIIIGLLIIILLTAVSKRM